MHFSVKSVSNSVVARRCALLVVTVCAVLALAAPAGATGRFLWVSSANDDLSTISSTGLDGTDPRTLVSASATGRIAGIAADMAHARLYWIASTDSGATWSLKQSALDGTGASVLSSSGATFNNPIGLAIDATRGRLYWVNAGGISGSISYANLDGSGGGLLLNSGVTASSGWPVVDPVGGRIYWHDGSIGFTTKWASLDGTASATALLTTDVACGLTGGVSYGSRIDRSGGFIYTTAQLGGVFGLVRTDLDGGNCAKLGTYQNYFMTDLAVDSGHRRAYVANDGGSTPTTQAGWWSLDTPYGFTWLPDTGAAGFGDSGYVLVLDAPSATKATSVVPASPLVGTPLTCAAATWAADEPNLGLFHAAVSTTAIIWAKDGTAIAGATGATYTPTAAGSYTCSASATNSIGTTTSTSAATVVSATPKSATPRLTGAPRIVRSGSSVSLLSSVRVGAAGSLSQRATYSSSARAAKTAAACSAVMRVKKAGTVTITCALNAKARAALRKGALKLTLTTTFTETGKASASTTRRVTAPRTTPSE